MLSKNSILVWCTAFAITMMLSGCSSWVYRISLPQGNYLEQSDVDKLRIDMTKEQVLYVLGNPVAKNAFDNSKWHYSYVFNIGRDSEQRKSLIVFFKDDRLSKITGDFKEPEDFNTPLE